MHLSLRFALASAAALVGTTCSSNSSLPAPDPGGVACTEEAKVCPDGSAVSRGGPNCEFAPCPEEVASSGATTSVPGQGGPASGECKDLCGNGTCEEVVCMAVGCPCPETKASCPKDCK